MAVIEERTGKDGKKRYRVKIRLKGYKPVSATFTRRTDAKHWMTQTEAAMREGRYFQAAGGKGKTLADAIERYARDILPNLKDSSHRFAQLNWWKNEIGEKELKHVTTALISECRDKLKSTPFRSGKQEKLRTDATVNRYIAALSPVLAAASNEWGWMQDNPCQKIRRGAESKGRTRFLSDDERKALLEACDQATDTPELKIIVLLALTTGGRRGEISGLRWQDVDLKRRRVIFVEPKNGETRAAPLVGPALEAMQEWSKVRPLDATAYVFPGRSDRTKDKPLDFERPWQTALKRANIQDFRFHDLRHTAASYLATKTIKQLWWNAWLMQYLKKMPPQQPN